VARLAVVIVVVLAALMVGPGSASAHEPPPGLLPPGDFTHEQQHYLLDLIDRTEAALPAFSDVNALPGLGFHDFGITAPGGWVHFINLGWMDDDRLLDPTHPESLVFRLTYDPPNYEPHYELVSAMFMLPRDYGLEDIPHDLAWLPGWHNHADVCGTDDWYFTTLPYNGECSSGHLLVKPPMMHVWIVDNPCGHRFGGIDVSGLHCDVHGGGHGEGPMAEADSYNTAEDTSLSVAAPGVLGNDMGEGLTAMLMSGPAHGTLSLDDDGSFTYTPAANYNGPDSFSYMAHEGDMESNVATVSLTVTPVNDAPTVAVAPGGSCGADDRSGTIKLTVADVDNPAGTLSLRGASGNQALVPNAGLAFAGSGTDRTLTARALAGQSGSAPLTVVVSDGATTAAMGVTLRAGGNGKSKVDGTAGADILLGQNGADSLAGLGGRDLLCGGNGPDALSGGPGADRFGGGPGPDRASDLNAAEGDTQDGSIP
jgi:hypothetical protein